MQFLFEKTSPYLFSSNFSLSLRSLKNSLVHVLFQIQLKIILFIYLVVVNLHKNQDTTGMFSPSHGALP